MVRRERIQSRSGGGRPDTEPAPEGLPRRPLVDTKPAAELLERIRQLLRDAAERR